MEVWLRILNDFHSQLENSVGLRDELYLLDESLCGFYRSICDWILKSWVSDQEVKV